MLDQIKSDSRTQELNQALELIHFGFRAITAWPDERLEELGYSRVHHRVLYFVGRHPKISIGELLDLLGVSKQYLHRPIRRLIDDGYLNADIDSSDKRVRRLRLSRKGKGLEEELSGNQRSNLVAVFEQSGLDAEEGWREVMKVLAAIRFPKAETPDTSED